MLRATPISVPKNNCVFSSEDGARENCLTILYGYAHRVATAHTEHCTGYRGHCMHAHHYQPDPDAEVRCVNNIFVSAQIVLCSGVQRRQNIYSSDSIVAVGLAFCFWSDGGVDPLIELLGSQSLCAWSIQCPVGTKQFRFQNRTSLATTRRMQRQGKTSISLEAFQKPH